MKVDFGRKVSNICSFPVMLSTIFNDEYGMSWTLSSYGTVYTGEPADTSLYNSLLIRSKNSMIAHLVQTGAHTLKRNYIYPTVFSENHLITRRSSLFSDTFRRSVVSSSFFSSLARSNI